MCGIFCAISRRQHIGPGRNLDDVLGLRGPDAKRRVDITAHNWTDPNPKPTYVTCLSTVLSVRGDGTVTQPFQSDSESCFCWNGEAWSISGVQVDGNDTGAVFKLLSGACSQVDASEVDRISTVAGALSQIAGPYAFVYYDELSSKVYFGRDFLGRRSLLWCVSGKGDILLGSVADASPGEVWSEVEADGIYCVHLSPEASGSDRWGEFAVSKSPYIFADQGVDNAISVIPKLSLNRQLPSTSNHLDEHSPSVAVLEDLLRKSLALRILNIPDPPQRDLPPGGPQRAKLAILFSGGLDCTTLARISHDLLPPAEAIDLLNVAFENPRIHKSTTESPFELCPDRITGRQSFKELQRVCPGRAWQFYAIDVPYHETRLHRDVIIQLMYPHNTEMDLSIANALYFAARGEGAVMSSTGESVAFFDSSARVLLSGLGADELFGGYTRHATAFNRRGLEGLLDELDLDISRLGKRNLGRDDRVLSYFGREARFPFLDETLLAWALSAPVTAKCDFGAEGTTEFPKADSSASIEPGKKVLRCLAWKLGMREVAREKKRAIQFGARTAKMESGSSKGTTVLS